MAAPLQTKDYFPEFRDVARNAVVTVDVQQATDTPFRNFRHREVALKHLRLCDVSCDPVVIERLPHHIARDGVEDAILTYQMMGEVSVEQRNSAFTLRAGDLAVIAAGQPYRIAYRRPSRRLFLRIPGPEFRRRVATGADHVAVQHLGNTPLGRIVSSLFSSISYEAEQIDEVEREVVAGSLLDLVATLVRHGDGLKPRDCRRAGGEHMDRVLGHIEQHFSDPELSPRRIAWASGISTRYLHTLFHHSGTTVSRWIWEQRLQACHETLLDPQSADHRISEIAFSNGYSDAAHFSRSFRKRFGVSPSEVRANAAGH